MSSEEEARGLRDPLPIGVGACYCRYLKKVGSDLVETACSAKNRTKRTNISSFLAPSPVSLLPASSWRLGLIVCCMCGFALVAIGLRSHFHWICLTTFVPLQVCDPSKFSVFVVLPGHGKSVSTLVMVPFRSSANSFSYWTFSIAFTTTMYHCRQ